MSAHITTGLPCPEHVEWGAHLCHFYETLDDLLDAIVPFFESGLAHRELCVWVTAPPLTVEHARRVLTARVPTLPRLIADGQIDIVEHQDFYLRGGSLDPYELLATWIATEQRALAAGYTGARAAGNMSSRKSREEWSKVEQYESRIDDVLTGHKMIALCSYHLGSTLSSDVLDVIRNHEFAIVRRNGRWEMIERTDSKEQQRHDLEIQLANALLLRDISATIVDEAEVSALYQTLLDGAVRVMGAEFATLQCYRDGELELLTHSGLSAEALRFWQRVPAESSSICTMAERARTRVLVPDVEQCGQLRGTADLEMYRRTGIRAVQSTPLLSRGGALVGMMSTGWRERYTPQEQDLRTFDIIARQAADLIERNRAIAALRARTDELVAANRHKDEFLATLAHELRNPLAPIQTGLAMLQSGDHAAVQRVVPMMERQLAHMVRLVDDLLDVSRVSRGKVTLRKELVSVRAVIDTAIETSRPVLQAARHHFETSISGMPLWIDADPTRISQVISNVLNNAAKYTPDGGHIRLVAEPSGDFVEVRITDSGVGIAAEQLPKVFDMFAQVDPTLERARGGLGIGLSLSKMLVEMHGGTIDAASAGLGRGSTFRLRLPLAPSPAVTSGERPVTERATEARRVLVVDDNIDAAEMLAMLLEHLGHTARVVVDSVRAVDEALAFGPDLVFLDIGMPGLNGFEVARRMRQRPELARTVLVALTGWGGEDARGHSREAGFDVHVTKPVAARMVSEILARCADSATSPAPTRDPAPAP